ncbi:MAG: DUF3786 domain-containing protein [Deltaproteobacteria bacterium]|nr:DUF3786 domain-containing protein [Deltaproteobacteria bacterium]
MEPIKPCGTDKAYAEALRLAWDKLAEMDPLSVSKRAKVSFDASRKGFSLTFLAQNYFISLQERSIFYQDGGPLYPFLSVLLLHYLVGAKDIPLQGEWITFRQLDGGETYFSAFSQRAIQPIEKTFGDKPQLLISCAEALGGAFFPYGDVGVKVPCFPMLPILVVLWAADEEFPASANILYDKSAGLFLPTEDLAVCGSMLTSALVKKAKALCTSKE